MSRFIVIENTPGYMPDADEPADFDDYAEAVAYLNAEVQRYVEDIEECDAVATVQWGIASADNLAAAIVYRDDRTYDLGRCFSVVLDDDEEPEAVEADRRHEIRRLDDRTRALTDGIGRGAKPRFQITDHALEHVGETANIGRALRIADDTAASTGKRAYIFDQIDGGGSSGRPVHTRFPLTRALESAVERGVQVNGAIAGVDRQAVVEAVRTIGQYDEAEAVAAVIESALHLSPIGQAEVTRALFATRAGL